MEYQYCAGCGRYFSDAVLTKVIAKADTVIPVKEMVAADYTAVDAAIEKAKALNKEDQGNLERQQPECDLGWSQQS